MIAAGRCASSRQVILTQYPPQSINLTEAKKITRSYLKGKGYGYRFTSQHLFRGITLSGDKRGRGLILKALKGEGLITWKGITKQDQEGRNNGYGGLWEVTKMAYTEQDYKTVKQGEHFQTWSSTIRNELINSNEWKQIVLTDKGKYILERV